jgi:hypothetical protein
VNNQRSYRFHVEIFNLTILNEEEGKKKYPVEVSNSFPALDDLDSEVDINSVWETIKENTKISTKDSLRFYEMKKHKPCFDEGLSKLPDKRKQAKLHWLQVTSEINGANLNNISRAASRHFRNRKREYLKDKINEPATNSKNKTLQNCLEE